MTRRVFITLAGTASAAFAIGIPAYTKPLFELLGVRHLPPTVRSRMKHTYLITWKVTIPGSKSQEFGLHMLSTKPSLTHCSEALIEAYTDIATMQLKHYNIHGYLPTKGTA